MITGYNTDVRYRERVFHVQTEDRGVDNPIIESVVYHGGQVLFAKKSDYEDLVVEGRGGDEIATRIERQHRMMIAAIKSGKLDEKIENALGEELAAEGDVTKLAGEEPGLLEQAKEESGPTLDQVILEYLTTEAEQDQLELELVNGTQLEAGKSCHLELKATSSKTGLPVSGAQVAVKMISTVRDPELLGKGTTDEEGGLKLDVAIPRLDAGAAAVIISASSLIGSAEVKHLL